MVRIRGNIAASESWSIVELVILRKLDALDTRVLNASRATAMMFVMAEWYATFLVLLFAREPEPHNWEILYPFD